MTREELLKEINRIIVRTGAKYLDEIIDSKNRILDCFDEIESKTCENCKHMDREYKISNFSKETYTRCTELDTIINGLDFGCNKWEVK